MVRVVDGDTAVVLVDLGFNTTREIDVRIYGVDTPERGQKDWQRATDFHRSWWDVLDDVEWPAVIETKKTDKYGRYVGTISTHESPTLNQYLGEWATTKWG